MRCTTTMLCTMAFLLSVAAAGAQQSSSPGQQPSTSAPRAQQPAQPSTPTPPTQQATPSSAGSTTLIGCLEPGATATAFKLNVLEQPGSTSAAGSGQARSEQRESGRPAATTGS